MNSRWIDEEILKTGDWDIDESDWSTSFGEGSQYYSDLSDPYPNNGEFGVYPSGGYKVSMWTSTSSFPFLSFPFLSFPWPITSSTFQPSGDK
jgi:hypothetical protein